MKKLEGRSLICIIIVLMVLAGLALFGTEYVFRAPEWAGSYFNDHIYRDGLLNSGKIKDRDGETLLYYDKEGAHFPGTEEQRRALSMVTGDIGSNISTGANVVFRDRLISYNLITGTEGAFGKNGGRVNLTVDKEITTSAYRELGNRKGFLGIYNWKTGEILCLVSNPTADPSDPKAKNAPEEAYLNKILSATYTPGSVFKVVTAAAAIENVGNIDQWTFECTGSHEINGEKITCPSVHGKMDFYGALANSCNCAFARLACDMGPDIMERYVKRLGMTSSYDISGIQTVPGSFRFETEPVNLGWAGIGQYEDKVNPMSVMVLMGAIAGDGKAANPVILDGAEGETIRLLPEDTAKRLQDMLRNNVKANYGDSNFPGLKLHAKSGTAEVGEGKNPHAWFAGYTGDYAFVVCVENGGSGASVAGPIAGKVLQQLDKTESADKEKKEDGNEGE